MENKSNITISPRDKYELIIQTKKHLDNLIKDYRICELKSLISYVPIINNPQEFTNIYDIDFELDDNHVVINYSHIKNNIQDESKEENTILTKIRLYINRDDEFKIGGSNNYDIYYNSKGVLRIICNTQRDISKSKETVILHMNNINIPEYLALRIIYAINYNDWSGDDFMNMLDV